MEFNKMKAIIKGTTCENETFEVKCTFELIPPKNKKYYGTGYYMSVEIQGEKMCIDVRYERTTDIEILADRWIANYYGKNAQEITKEF